MRSSGVGGAAALQMSKNAGARFFSGACGNFTRHHISNSTESKFSAFDVALNLLTVFGSRALRHDDE